MEIIILGETKDQKGTELEKLCKRLFEKLGFNKSALNIVKSGANEYDVKAESTKIVDGKKVSVSIIAECKAHRKKCELPDFLKFLGKLYCEKNENPNTEGYFIALSGVNGNFLGAFESLSCVDKSIHLIVEEDLINFLNADYKLSDAHSVRLKVSQFTNRVIDSIDLSLYDNNVYWLVRFNSKDYTILSSECEPMAKEDIKKIHTLLLNYEYYNFIDLSEEQEHQKRLAYVRGIILCLALNQNAKDKESVQKMLNNTGVFIDEFEQVRLSEIEFVSNDYPLNIININSKVEFFSYLLSNDVFVETITSAQYQSLVDTEFLKEICDIQGGLKLTDDEQKQALRLLKVSHTAIINAIQPDKLIINSIKNINLFNNLPQDKVRELGVTKFMGRLIEGANEDLCTQPYSKILHKLGVYQYDILQRIILNNGKNDEVRIERNPKTIIAKAENLPGKPVFAVLSFNNESESIS